MTDGEFLAQLAELDLTRDLAVEVGRRRMELGWNAQQARAFTQVGPWLFLVNETLWRTSSAGAVALALAVEAQGRWTPLPAAAWEARSIRAWNRTIADACQYIDREFDAGLAKALSPSAGRKPGIHLRRGPSSMEIRLQSGAGTVTCAVTSLRDT